TSDSVYYPTGITGTATIHDNYFDASSAYGVFYPGTFNGWSVYNNIDLTNGNTINVNNTESPTTTLPTSPSPPTAPAVPSITSFSPDTGSIAGLTDANVLTLTGTGAAGSTVNLYDGSLLLGTTAVGSTGSWSFLTATLVDGVHNFTATDTLSGATSV